MTKGEISKSIQEKVIESALNKLWALLIGSIAIPPTIYLLIKNILIRHPYVLLVLLIITTITTFVFLWLWIRLYWRYERLIIAFGVKWDKKYNMRCMNCEKPLKYSTSEDSSKFFCPDEKYCNSKHILKDDNGNRIEKHQAIELLKRRKKRK